MKRRTVLAAAAATFVAVGIACVDLFHGTEFETLCTRSPNDSRCGADSAAPIQDAADAEGEAATPPPPVQFCDWKPAEARKHALAACARLGACMGPLGESAFGPCVVRAQLAYDCQANPALRPGGTVEAFWRCLDAARSCPDVKRCISPVDIPDCPAVALGRFTACGTKDAVVQCEKPGAGPATGVEPCAMLGKTCAVEDPSFATCSGALKYDKCTQPECRKAAAVDCEIAAGRTFDRGVDCTGFGAGSCIMGDAGPRCVPVGDLRCFQGDTPFTCDGRAVKACVGGLEVTINCDLLGLECDVSKPVPEHDPAAACTATTCTGEDTCTGIKSDTVESCGRGTLFSVSCASVGLGPCKVTNGHAACTPK